MHGRDRAALEYRGERGAVRAVQTRRLSGRLAINQPFRPMGVELHHPIANDLERHPADLRRLGPARAVVNRRQRQKPPGLRPILRPLRGGPNHPRIKISPKWNGHGEPPVLATLNQTHANSGIPSESRLLSFGIKSLKSFGRPISHFAVSCVIRGLRPVSFRCVRAKPWQAAFGISERQRLARPCRGGRAYLPSCRPRRRPFGIRASPDPPSEPTVSRRHFRVRFERFQWLAVPYPSRSLNS